MDAETGYSTFRKGDIVQAWFTIIVIPVKGSKRCIKLLLRALKSIHADFTAVSKQRNPIKDTTNQSQGR